MRPNAITTTLFKLFLARILSIGLVVTVALAWSAAAAVENARELAGYCQSLERGAKGVGRHIYIQRTREALTCWGYMQAMQDLSVLADEEGHRIMYERLNELQRRRLLRRTSAHAMRARIAPNSRATR